MRGVCVGAALLAALVFGVPVAFAQSPYGVGGYLERPYVPDDDEYDAPPPESAAEAARRQRRARAAAQEEQAQTQASGAGSQSSGAPQTTGATQGGQQRRPAASGAGSGQGANAPQQPRRAASQGTGSASSADQTPHQQQRPDQQRPPAIAQDEGPAAPQRNRPSNAAAPTMSRAQQSPASADAARRQGMDGDPMPPVPMRRPNFADAPKRQAVTAKAVPDPTPAETPPQETPTEPLPQPRTEVAAAAPEVAATATPESAPPPAVEKSGAMEPAASAESPSTPPAEATTESPAPQQDAVTADRVAMTAPGPTTPAPAETAAASPQPAEAAPQEKAAADQRVAPAASDDMTQDVPSTMMAATELPSVPAETPEQGGNTTQTQPPAETAAKAIEPVPPALAEPAATEKPAPDAAAEKQPVDSMRAEAARHDAPSAPAIPEPQAQTMIASTPPETPAPAAAFASPTPAAAPQSVAIAVTPPPAQTPAAAPVTQDVIPDLPVRPTRVANASDAMTQVPQPPARQSSQLDKMIGQMMIVGFRGLTPEEAWPQKLTAQIKSGTIGGVLFMSHNVQSPQQLKTLTGFLHKARSDIPVLFAVDQEGGIVQRLSAEKGFQTYPTAGKIGKSNDPLTAYGVYRRLAAELAYNGFNLNLGPVVDLLRNDASPIIAGKERSFGPQPKHVASFAKAFCLAHQDEGVLTVLKHFPGHGSTPFDTHVQAVDVGQTWSVDEIVPYRELIASRTAQAVMSGHIANPAMADEPGLPASLSAKAIRTVLRGDLGFSGVVISDDLEMGAIRARYSIEDSVVKAIKAGNDIVILSNQAAPNPDLPERVAAAIKKAVETGELRREELQASYDRILSFKQRISVPAATANSGNNPAAKRASAERSGRAASAR